MPASSIVRRLEIAINGRVIPYTFCRVPRRRHVHLVIQDSGELQVRAPYHYSAEKAETQINLHAQWILKNLEQMHERLSARPSLETGSELPLLGERLILNVNPVEQIDFFAGVGDMKLGEVRRFDKELRVRSQPGDSTDIRRLLEHWYRNEAKQRLVPLIYGFANRIGVIPMRVSIRGQKTCWGSCTSRGSISLNWRLMMLPLELAEYVLVHELCHLRFLNHSASFWSLVEHWVPDFRERRWQLEDAQRDLAF